MKQYLIQDVLKILNFKRATGNFQAMLQDLKIPSNYVMKKDSFNRLRKFRTFSENELTSMKNYRKTQISSEVLTSSYDKNKVIKEVEQKIAEVEKLLMGLKNATRKIR